MSAQARLTLALCVSGLVLGVLAGPHLGHPWWGAALAPVPLVLAARCLPLAPALLVTLGAGIGGRALGSLGAAASGGLAVAAVGALGLLPALLADRSLSPRHPRSAAVAFTAVALAAAALLRALGSQAAPLPVASEGVAGALAERVGFWAPPLLCAALAQGVAGLASVGNWHRRDPLPQDEREASAREIAVAAATLALAAGVGAAVL